MLEQRRQIEASVGKRAPVHERALDVRVIDGERVAHQAEQPVRRREPRDANRHFAVGVANLDVANDERARQVAFEAADAQRAVELVLHARRHAREDRSPSRLRARPQDDDERADERQPDDREQRPSERAREPAQHQNASPTET